MIFSLFRSCVARRRDATALKGRAAASAPSSYFWRVLTDFRLLMVCIFIFFLASSPPLPFHSRPFSVHGAHSLARHASQAPSLRRWCPLPGHASPTPPLRRWCSVPRAPLSIPSFPPSLSGPRARALSGSRRGRASTSRGARSPTRLPSAVARGRLPSIRPRAAASRPDGPAPRATQSQLH